jgi:hypothetical protein
MRNLCTGELHFVSGSDGAGVSVLGGAAAGAEIAAIGMGAETGAEAGAVGGLLGIAVGAVIGAAVGYLIYKYI